MTKNLRSARHLRREILLRVFFLDLGSIPSISTKNKNMKKLVGAVLIMSSALVFCTTLLLWQQGESDGFWEKVIIGILGSFVGLAILILDRLDQAEKNC